jgi:hypothetical protein
MRVLGWVLAGALAPTPSIGVQAGSLGPGYYPMPNGWNGDWRRVSGPSQQWKGSGPPHWVPYGPPGGCCPYPGPGVPTYSREQVDRHIGFREVGRKIMLPGDCFERAVTYPASFGHIRWFNRA